MATDYSIFHRLANTEAIHLQFNDLTYETENSKVLVNGVSGIFRASELTAIIGPSGCGKTTLLNLLSGYRIHKTSGEILINGEPQDMKRFRKIARYVLQDDHISPYFTLMETMIFASKLKMDTIYSREQREQVINEILDIFDLQAQVDTSVANLSGGQRKRLCIALELIGNPSVLFLDEPTTGLDEFSASQCIRLLKKLAKCGRTIVCSLHCPSATLYQMFDKVYAMSRGQCIYQGPVNNIVPYLQQFDLNCPQTYNPTDFIIEVATEIYGDFQKELVEAIENGKISKWIPTSPPNRLETNQLPCKRSVSESISYFDNLSGSNSTEAAHCNSWWNEFKILFVHLVRQMWRDKSNCKMRILIHILSGLLIGFTFTNVNSNAKVSIFTYHLAMIVIIKFFFLPMMPVLASVPRDMMYLRREYFNQWYRLSAYFMALVSAQLPMLSAMAVIGSAIIYFSSGQPVQLYRFMFFVGISFLISMMASSFGLVFGSRFSVVHALFLAPYVMVLMVVIASYAVERNELSGWEQLLLQSSFLKYAIDGYLYTLLDFNRPNFPCPPNEIFCITAKPKYILKLAGNLKPSYVYSVLGLLGFYLLFTFMSYAIFKQRLRSCRNSKGKLAGTLRKIFNFKLSSN
ncbi:ATP-binding cassette sub-family G member 1-like [Musca autumnalis]|uniref:ATP-binding cassette sub-family G member 1-like n=1 Tax=Musca autumnalis TaxID=221902 RepID=UPI003CE89D84